MEALESQIARWRGMVAQGPAVDDRDVEELEAHLREQIADLDAAGLAADEAFLVAVKRMGSLDSLSREFAREHSDRLWKQLVLSGGGEQERSDSRCDRTPTVGPPARRAAAGWSATAERTRPG